MKWCFCYPVTIREIPKSVQGGGCSCCPQTYTFLLSLVLLFSEVKNTCKNCSQEARLLHSVKQMCECSSWHGGGWQTVGKQVVQPACSLPEDHSLWSSSWSVCVISCAVLHAGSLLSHIIYHGPPCWLTYTVVFILIWFDLMLNCGSGTPKLWPQFDWSLVAWLFKLLICDSVVTVSAEPRGPPKSRRQFRCSDQRSFRSLRKSVASSCRRRCVNANLTAVFNVTYRHRKVDIGTWLSAD